MSSSSILRNDVSISNFQIHEDNRITNSSNNEMPPVKIPRDMPTKSLQTRKVVSNVLFGLETVADTVSYLAAFAVIFLPLPAIVVIGITSVTLLTTGIILRLKKDTLSEENLPEVIKHLAKKDEDYIRNNNQFVNNVIEFCGKKGLKDLEDNRSLPDIIKILAKSDEGVITSNKDFVGKVIEFCDNNKVLADTFNKGYIEDVKSLTEKLKNESEAKLNEIEKKLNYQNELIKSISSLEKGGIVCETGKEETNFQNITLSQQKNNDTKTLDEMVSFFENQENKNKLIELVENHTCGIMGYEAVIDNNGTISKFEKYPNEAFSLLKKENNADKKSKDTENYDVNLNEIEEQSNKDFNQPVTLIIENEEIKTENLDDLEKKIREKLQDNSDKIIKKILAFPEQSSFDISTIFSAASNENIKNKAMHMNIQYKIEIKGDDVYLYASNKYKGTKNDDEILPICIEDSKKYRLNDQIEGNDQEEGKYTVPTLLAEHIAVFEAKPYVTKEGNLAYLKIGEKKSEFNWINPKPEELVTLDVEKDAVNDRK